MRRPLLTLGLPLALVAWGLTGLFAVDQAEFAHVTRFGAPVAALDGATDAGLHVKWPWPVESVRRVDRRLQVFDLPPVESLTRDPVSGAVDKTVAVDAYVCWRVPDATALERFVRAVGTPAQARRLLGPRVGGRLAAVVAGMDLGELVGVADADAAGRRADALRARLLGDGLAEAVLAEYGVELADVRVRRFGFPEAVREAIAERVRAERARKAAEYESDGRRRAAEIAAGADREARAIEASARADRQRAEAAADAEADRLRGRAHARDPEFFAFLQKMRAYQTMFAESRDVLLLSTRSELFDLLLKPPAPAVAP